MNPTIPPKLFGGIALVLTGAVLPQEIHAGAMPVLLVATAAAALIFGAAAVSLVIENKNGGK
jgi:hypothetical protein